MSKRDEIQLRHLKSIWESRQEAAGLMTFFLGFLTLGAGLVCLSAPGHQFGVVVVCLMMLLVASCWRLVSSAAGVVEIGKLLPPSRVDARSRPEVVEAEVVGSVSRRALLN